MPIATKASLGSMLSAKSLASAAICNTGADGELRSTGAERRRIKLPLRSTIAAAHFVPPRSMANAYSSALRRIFVIERFMLSMVLSAIAPLYDCCQSANRNGPKEWHDHAPADVGPLRNLANCDRHQHAADESNRK